MKVKIEFNPGLFISIKKVSDNPGVMHKGSRRKGELQILPTIGCRCNIYNGRGSVLSTNVVAKIHREDEKGGLFETLSGSKYKWEILKKTDKKDKSVQKLEIPEEILRLLKEYNDPN